MMKPSIILVAGLLAGGAVAASPLINRHVPAAEQARPMEGSAGSAHTHESFSFIANAPMKDVAPLFGAAREKVWAPDWNPQFIWPVPAEDREGMVFSVAHGHRHAIWVNTGFDLKNGNVQYVYVIPEVMTARITLTITPEGERTRVQVDYERTALAEEASPLVAHTAAADAKAGAEWEEQINGYLARRVPSR
jgi:hypothetical protein